MVFFSMPSTSFFRLLDEGFAGLYAGLRRQFLELALDVTAPQVARHDDDGVLEVHHASLVVGQTAVVEHLQEDVEYVRMRLFYFIEQNYRVRFAAYGLRELSALIVSYVSRRRTDQPAYAEFLLIFRHVDTRHQRLVVEEVFGQSLGQFGLAYTGRSLRR